MSIGVRGGRRRRHLGRRGAGVLVAGGGARRRCSSLPGLGARPVGGAWTRCRAFFLAIVATIAVVATLYSVDYMTHFASDSAGEVLSRAAAVLRRRSSACWSSADFLFFLVFWELMTLTSFFLVTFERENARQPARRPEVLRDHPRGDAVHGRGGAGAVAPVAARSTSPMLRRRSARLLVARPVLAHLVLVLLLHRLRHQGRRCCRWATGCPTPTRWRHRG